MKFAGARMCPLVGRRVGAVALQFAEFTVVHTALAHDALTKNGASSTQLCRRERHRLVRRHERTSAGVSVVVSRRPGDCCRRRRTTTSWTVTGLDGGEQSTKSFSTSSGIYTATYKTGEVLQQRK